MTSRKNAIKSVAVLSAIALICGLLLAVINMYTQVDRNSILHGIYDAKNGYETVDFSSEESVTAMYKAKDEDYYIVVASGNGNGGEMQIYVSISGRNVVKLTPGTHKETAGYMEKVLNENTMSNFLQDIDQTVFAIKQDGGDVDAVATATNTTKGVLNAITAAVNHYKLYLGEALPKTPTIWELLQDIHNVPGGYEKINFESEHASAMYKAKGEDYYIVIAEGAGGGGRGKTVLEMYVSIKENKVVKLTPGEHNETAGYMENVIGEGNIDRFLRDIDNIIQDGGEVDAVAEATNTTNAVANAVFNAANYYKGYMVETLNFIKEIYDAPNGYQKVDFESEHATAIYKAVDEDYYVVVANGTGGGRNGDTVLKMFVSISGNKLTELTPSADNSESKNWLARVLATKEQYFRSVDSAVFKLSPEGDIDVIANNTNTFKAMTEAVFNAVNHYKLYRDGQV